MIHVGEGLLKTKYKNEMFQEELTDNLPMVEVCHLTVWSANGWHGNIHGHVKIM